MENKERRRRSQDKIEKAFVELILTEDRRNINVSNICKLAKVNRTTFYTNYIDMCDLISKIKHSKFKLFNEVYENKETRSREKLLALFEDAKKNKKFYLAWLNLSLERDCIMPTDYLKQEKSKFDNVEDFYSEFGFKQGLLTILYCYLRDGCPIEPDKLVDLVFIKKYLPNV